MSKVCGPVLVLTAAGVALAGCAVQSAQSGLEVEPAAGPAAVQDLPLAYQNAKGGVQVASLGTTASDAPGAMSGRAGLQPGQVVMVLTQEADEDVPLSTIEQRIRDVARQEASQAATQAASQAAQKVALDAENIRSMAQREAQQVAQREAAGQAERLAKMAQITQQAAKQAAQDEVRQAAGQAQLQTRQVAEQVAQKEAQRVALQTQQQQTQSLASLAQTSQLAARQAAQDEVRQAAGQAELQTRQVAEQVAQREARLSGQQLALQTQRAVEEHSRQNAELAQVSRWAAQQEAQQAARQVAQQVALQTALEASRQTAARVAEDKAAQVAQNEARQVAQQVVDQSPVALDEKRMRQLAQQEAQQAVDESRPQMKALALESLKDSRDYIGTVARGAVREGDPAMAKALSEAARSAIASDDRVVFAIRKAVEAQFGQSKGGATGVAGGTGMTVMKSDEIAVNSANLAIGALQEPEGGSKPAAAHTLAEYAPDVMLEARAPSSIPRKARLDIRKYRVVLHEDDRTLQQLLEKVMGQAEPFTGPWAIKWKISDANKDLLNEKFSLDVETSFDNFVSYLSQYMVNERGVKISFSLFDTERIIVVSD